MSANSDVIRLISASKRDFQKMTPQDLKLSIQKSEHRTIMAQHLMFADDGVGMVRGVTNTELLFANGADLVLLNAFNFDDVEGNVDMQGLSYAELKERCGQRPIGFYMGCSPDAKASESDAGLYNPSQMSAAPKHVKMAVDWGADFIVLGGDPGTGTKLDDIIAATRRIKGEYGDRVMVWAGKWEDGVTEKVLGDPSASLDSKQIVKELIDAGADVINLPAPGSRGGITVECVRDLVTFVHAYKPGTLAMTFLDSNVECADVATIRQVALLMKQTGADVHAIGDGGFGGCTFPENVYQLSVSIKGRAYTYFRMASTNR